MLFLIGKTLRKISTQAIKNVHVQENMRQMKNEMASADKGKMHTQGPNQQNEYAFKIYNKYSSDI